MSAARSLFPNSSDPSHAPSRPRRLSQRALTVVPDADDTSAAAAANARVEVAICCAQADLAKVGRIFDALERFDCKPLALPGVERDPMRMTVSVESARQPRLYVVCKTRMMDLPQVRRMVRAFSQARDRERHQLLVIEVDTDRVYASVPKIRRGAETLRRRLCEEGPPSAPPVAFDFPVADDPVSRLASAVGRRKPRVDTTYAHHRGGSGPLDRTHVELEHKRGA